MSAFDDISANLILLESERKGLVNTLKKLHIDSSSSSSSSVSSLTLQCQKIQQLSNSIQIATRTRFELLQSKEVEIQNRLKELELREKELGKPSKSKLDEVLIGKKSSLLGLKFIVSTVGERLLMFLNVHENEHEKLADEVYNVLKMSNSPGKLVWQAVKRVFMEKTNVGVEEKNVERRSCLVLLEGLMRIRPIINKKVKNEATFAAKAWKLSIGMEAEDELEILLFLMLMCAFGLLGQFESNEIRSLFEKVAHHKQASLLGHNLGFFNKAASCIESCIKMEQSGEVSNVMSEAVNDTKINCSSPPPSADLRFIASSDTNMFLMFLNEHENDERIGVDVYDVLKMPGNPKKFVLKVVKAAISHKVNVRVESGVVNNSCVILLEQLMRLMPLISQKMRKKALKVAQQWKGNITKDGNYYDKELLVFLMLVEAYELTSEFDSKELESLFESVSQHKQATLLSSILGSIDQTFLRGIHRSSVKIEPSEAENFQFGSFVPSQPKFEQHIASSSTSSWLELKSLCINMNARGLISFLSEHVDDHNLMQREISDALQRASDPAKLVLDALSYFYRSKSGDGIKGVALCYARKSCILLLEQLMACSVQIKPHVNEEALKFAVEWKERMDEKYPQGVMAYGFLQFIISYQLMSSYNVDELLCLLVTASQYRQSPHLCLALGLADKISILIEALIKNNLRLEAIAYVCAFNLADNFPPAHLLNDHLKHSKMMKCRKAKKSNVKLNVTIDQEIAIMRRVIRCVTDHKLESIYPPQDLENYILHLERQKELGNETTQRDKQKAEKKKNLPMSSTKAKVQQESGLNRPCNNMSGEATPSLFASAGGNLHLKPSPLEQPVSLITDQTVPCNMWDSAFSVDTNSFNWEHGCENVDNWSLEHFTSTRAVDKASPETSIHHAQVNIDEWQSDNFYSDTYVPSEAKFKQYTTCSSTSYAIDLQSYSTSMDAMGLIIFLCKHVEDHDLMRCEISDALQLAPDPAKLVLDAVSTFYKSNIKNAPKKNLGNDFYTGPLGEVRKSCILLLEQLRTFSFQIDPRVYEEVSQLAFSWKEKTQKNPKGVMAYGFLQLTVTYSLISAYESDELFGLLVTASEYQQSPDLCLALGLTDKIRVLIETLIKNNLRLEAVGYICAFDLVDKFPPARILKDHLEYSESLHQESKQSHQKHDQVAAVRKVIADHKLGSLFPPSDLEDYIKQMEEQKADRNDATRKEKHKADRNDATRKEKHKADRNDATRKEKHKADRNDATVNEKQKISQKKTPKASSANPKPQPVTKLPSPTTSTAGSSTKLSPLQLLESFFADQAVSHVLRDSATFSASSNILSNNQQAEAAVADDKWSSD